MDTVTARASAAYLGPVLRAPNEQGLLRWYNSPALSVLFRILNSFVLYGKVHL
jgi:hypothetical protein